MPPRDFYDILGVPRTASQDEIKRAYRKLAKAYHPDRNPGNKNAETRFKEVQEAYDTLNDPQKRKTYDQFGHTGVGAGGGPQSWRSGPTGEHVYTWQAGGGPDIPVENLEDLFKVFSQAGGGEFGGRPGGSIFEEFFSGPGSRGRRRRPASPAGTETAAPSPVEHPVILSFEQALQGTTLDLHLSREGGPAGTETVRVRIPPGVAEGQRIRIRGKGNSPGTGGPPGDLYIVCNIQPHRYFRRLGNDILLDLPLSIAEAALGTKVEVPTLDGKMVLTVPPGTPSGAKLRLKGKGVKPPGNKPQGDLYVVVRIVPPKNLTPRQRELLEQLRATEESPRKETGW
jgi:curved DNA-binding protein